MNYAYCRASTIVQETSCDVQAAMLQQGAERDGATIDHVFTDEDTSGRVFPFLDREAARQFMAVVQRGDHLWVHKIDRLGRNTVDILNTTRMLLNREVHVHVLDLGGQAINLEGSAGFFIIGMMAVNAEAEAKRISERTTEALKYRRDRGMPVNGWSPYGMRRKHHTTATGRRPYDEWDGQECADIKEIYDAVHNRNECLYTVAQDFARAGRLTAKGKYWAKPPIKEGRPWRDDRVRRTFRWYTCMRELGLDVESTPVAVATMFSTAWRKAKSPKSIAQWRCADPDGLQKFVELAKRAE